MSQMITKAAPCTCVGTVTTCMGTYLQASQPGLWPAHTHLVAAVLRHLFNFEDASICRYTFKRPDWMLPVRRNALMMVLPDVGSR